VVVRYQGSIAHVDNTSLSAVTPPASEGRGLSTGHEARKAVSKVSEISERDCGRFLLIFLQIRPARGGHLQNLLPVSLRVQTVLNEPGPVTAQYLGLVSLVGAFIHLDLFGTPLFGGHAVLRSDLVRVDQFLGKAGLQGNRCENRHCKHTPNRGHENSPRQICWMFPSPASARHL
jgi:hypothetical protein